MLLLDCQGAARKEVALDFLKTSLPHVFVIYYASSSMIAVTISPKSTALMVMVIYLKYRKHFKKM